MLLDKHRNRDSSAMDSQKFILRPLPLYFTKAPSNYKHVGDINVASIF